jgi:colanic acid biosynthesis glycosyl transferase WcaI
VLAAIDPDTAVPRILAESGGGVAVSPDDPAAFIAGLAELLEDFNAASALGAAGRTWAVANASPAAVGQAYSDLIAELRT